MIFFQRFIVKNIFRQIFCQAKVEIKNNRRKCWC